MKNVFVFPPSYGGKLILVNLQSGYRVQRKAHSHVLEKKKTQGILKSAELERFGSVNIQGYSTWLFLELKITDLQAREPEAHRW